MGSRAPTISASTSVSTARPENASATRAATVVLGATKIAELSRGITPTHPGGHGDDAGDTPTGAAPAHAVRAAVFAFVKHAGNESENRIPRQSQWFSEIVFSARRVIFK